jgi:hypothetical protein
MDNGSRSLMEMPMFKGFSMIYPLSKALDNGTADNHPGTMPAKLFNQEGRLKARPKNLPKSRRFGRERLLH